MNVSIEDIYLKVGRNIVIFQAIEKKLKIILANNQLSGPASQLAEIRKNNILSVKKKTLGGLIQQFTSNFTTGPENNDCSDIDDDISEAHFSFKIYLSTNSEQFENRKSQLANILKERNGLVHHLLLNLNLSIASDRIELAKKLDIQFEHATIEHQRLEFDINILQQTKNLMSEFVASPYFTNLSINPELINCLIYAIEKHARSDGWTDLSHAGRIISQQMPEKYRESLESNKTNKLSDLIYKTDLFELTQEKNENNVTRTYFRPIDANLTKIWYGTWTCPVLVDTHR